MLAETIDSWFIEAETKGLQKGLQKRLSNEKRLLVRMAGRIFAPEIMQEVGTLLEQVKSEDEIDKIGDWIVGCETAEELLNNIKQLLSSEEKNDYQRIANRRD